MNASTEDPLNLNDSNGIDDLNARRPLATVISMSILYTSIFVTGVIGNMSTCFVIKRHKHMKTATNYYLFSLAISDLCLLILGLPQEIYMLWQPSPYTFGEIFCFFRGLTSETSTNASVLTITAFTFERYMAICHPLKAHTMSKLSRVIRLIIIIWILAAVGALPVSIQFGVVYKELNGIKIPETAECTLKEPIKHAFEISTFIFFVMPFTLICVLYMFIGLQLRRSEDLSRSNQSTTSSFDAGSRQPTLLLQSSPQLLLNNKLAKSNILGHSSYASKTGSLGHRRSTNILSNRTTVNSASRRAVIKMLVAVVVAFFVCWTPFQAQRLMAIYVTEPTSTDEIIFEVLTYISGITYYVSATINPILYSIMSLKFREAFKDTLGQCCGRRSTTTRFGKFESRNSSLRASTLKESLKVHIAGNNNNTKIEEINYNDNDKLNSSFKSKHQKHNLITSTGLLPINETVTF